MEEQIARIHYKGVIAELATIGIKPELDYDFFKNRWKEVGIDNVKTFPKGKVLGFITKMDGETMLYVDNNHLREGIGSVLLGMEDVTKVWIIDGNYRAEGFYEKHGFKKTPAKRIQSYFGYDVKESLYVN